jgi:diaminohydroxyphosphoribosylaminopyrimidine deaminase/5-amino-6-(5-phosphoribosylamino)uracil reductase
LVVDSQLRIPPHCKMLDSCRDDVVIVTTSAAAPDRRKAVESRGAKVLTFDGQDGRVDLRSVVNWLAGEKYLSLMIEAGSRLNWAVLEADIVDKIFFYYGAKILGGLQALPMAGGTGRRRRVDAIGVRDLVLHNIANDEFAVEGYVHRNH